MRCLPSAGPRVDGTEGVTVLASGGRSTFPVEVHALALERFTEPAGYLDDFTAARFWSAVVPQSGKVHPAAAWSIGGIDDSPTLLAMPHPHCPYRLHIHNSMRKVALAYLICREMRLPSGRHFPTACDSSAVSAVFSVLCGADDKGAAGGLMSTGRRFGGVIGTDFRAQEAVFVEDVDLGGVVDSGTHGPSPAKRAPPPCPSRRADTVRVAAWSPAVESV
jgi:hypothetical protein